MQQIILSAMLQSQQTWLPVLSEPLRFETYIRANHSNMVAGKFIAHCEDENNKQMLSKKINPATQHNIILIGPEGDFSSNEISNAIQSGFEPVALGSTRLRTETAGIVAATIFADN